MSLSTLILVVFLLLFAGLLAGCESALTSLSRLLIEESRLSAGKIRQSLTSRCAGVHKPPKQQR